MQFAHLATSFLAISQLLFTITYFLIHHRRIENGKLYALFCLCIIAYIADNLSVLDKFPAINNTASFLAILTPGLFWMICRSLYEDDSQTPNWFIGTLVFYTTLRFIGILAEDSNIAPSHWIQFIFFTLPNIIMLTIIIHTIYMATRGRRHDLVESRRNTRILFSLLTAMLLLAVVTFETMLLPNTILDNILYFVVFLISLIANIHLFELKYRVASATNEQHPLTAKSWNTTPAPNLQDEKLIDQIQKSMEHERRYSTMGLTISTLAGELQTSEHRLRRVINHQLHFRNFNQFLNHYRIGEASQRLKSPAESHIPILTIAMDVGYRSLSAFNKAFLLKHQTTPSNYRKKPENIPR